ncbi:T9SS type A sorting domain-containing protein [Sporocytophaga myxococcoides]|uniref:T9SS type A sorting domain-containing protein n=1 Tax=Sporocytophaga myxococcoides TaxID=153721 RepID=UPI0004024484|nr:FG-GAP-like repeat-containing protein [Sporocytophaga myxococcoides]
MKISSFFYLVISAVLLSNLVHGQECPTQWYISINGYTSNVPSICSNGIYIHGEASASSCSIYQDTYDTPIRFRLIKDNVDITSEVPAPTLTYGSTSVKADFLIPYNNPHFGPGSYKIKAHFVYMSQYNYQNYTAIVFSDPLTLNQMTEIGGSGFTKTLSPINPDQNKQASFILKGDFAGDSGTDILYHWRASGANNLHISNASGSFTSTASAINPTSSNNYPDYAIAGDFRGSGKTDIFFHWKSSGANTLFTSLDNGTFSQSTSAVNPVAINGSPDLVLSGDFSGDAKSDLLFVWRSTGANNLQTSNGTSFIQTNSVIPAAAINGYPDVVIAGDFGGNSKEDLFIYWKSTGTNRILINNGNGNFTAQYSNPISSSSINGSPENILIGDFAGDTKKDLYFHWKSTGTNKLMVANGVINATYSFTEYINPIAQAAANESPDHAFSTDFNADGKSDLYFHWGNTGRNRIHLSQNDGTFTHCKNKVETCSTNEFPSHIISGNFNSDAGSDLLFYWINTGANRLFKLIPSLTCTTTYRVASVDQENNLSEEMNGSVLIYPNPNDGSFDLEGLDNTLFTGTISILNTQGVLVYREHSDNIFARKHLSLSNLENGLYHLVINNGSDKSITKSFIIKK